jgi:acyl-CoA synthetase (AMP-forming)/AMP-acid ligase II
VGVNEPDAPVNRRELGELLERRAAGGATAFVEGATGRRLGWHDVGVRAAGWRAAAPDLGARRVSTPGASPADPTARVGLLLADPLEMAAAFVSALAAGVTVAPLNPASTAAELMAATRTLGLAAVVAGEADLDGRDAALRASDVDLWAAGPSGVAALRRSGGDAVTGGGGGAAMLLSSSGTTGTPKLIPLLLGPLVDTARSVVAHHHLEPTDVAYSPLPLFHINGLVVGVLSALVGGHRLVLERRFSASSFWDVVERNGVTWLNLVPAVISVLADRPAPEARQTARLGWARSASAPLPTATLERFERATGVTVIETYGMTEAASQVTANPRTPGERRPGSVGVPVGVELRVTDREHRPVPAGTVGLVEIRGERIVTEYWAPPGGASAPRPARGRDGWLVTGDLGRLDADGYLYLAGRDDDVINRGGEKVYPREVEEVLFADVGVAEAAVVGRPHATVGEVPVAFVVGRPGLDGDALVARLTERCAAELSRSRRPAEILLVDSLPSGLNGKVRRADLRTMAWTGRSPGRNRREAQPHTTTTAPSGRGR